MAPTSWIGIGLTGLALASAGLMAACATTGTSSKLDAAATLARGGRLYDNWMTETSVVNDPVTAHPSYPTDGAYADRPASTWRCKECHGWDYLGADGAYADGKHFTGIPGIAHMDGRPASEVEAILRDATHGYDAVLTDTDLRAVALFVAEGQVAMNSVIARASKTGSGDAVRGGAHYATLCAGCHGLDGKADDMPALGPLARRNPWETLHKILNGQPASAMPALRSLNRHVALDVLRYTQTLPE